MKKNCEQCAKEYSCRPARAHISRFCSTRCRCDWEKIHGRILLTNKERKTRQKKPIKEFKCEGCGKQFTASGWKDRKYCTRECGCSHIGQISHHNIWNKGLSKDDPRVVSKVKKQSQTLKDRYESGEIEVWNKGLTAETDERMARMVAAMIITRNTEGPRKEKWRESMRQGQVKAWAAGKYDRPITSPEQLTWNHLESLGYHVKWFKDIVESDPTNTWYFQFPFANAFVPDFACIDLKCIIEVNGCVVHAHDLTKCLSKGVKYGLTEFGKTNAQRDRKKHSLYYRKGWKWATVWQCEADNNDFHRLSKYLGLRQETVGV